MNNPTQYKSKNIKDVIDLLTSIPIPSILGHVHSVLAAITSV